ncbi:hypothetical protein GCM10022295_93030 [Streptomyces osmaniensis]|uniref:Mutator family transposase n=1 Tax=Streptomyces osmaniensis TaxID=593134 RepID=A0ABP6Z5X6_9ACTN
MTSENVTDPECVESAEAVSAKAVDGQLIDELVHRAQAGGLQLTGEGGLLQQLTKRLLESALEGEITDHLGYDKHDAAGKNGGNSRNGKRSKTVLTDVGPVEITVPRDRDGSFETKIVKKRQKRLTGVDEMVIALAAKGLTTGEVQAHLAEVYGAEVSRQTISTITDKVLEGMAEWQGRPLDTVCPVVFIDAIHVKIRDGAVANRPICGPATAARAPSTGCTSSRKSRTAASATCSCWSATGSRACPKRWRPSDPGRSCRPVSCICCGTPSATPPVRTGTRSPGFSSLSTPLPPKRPPWTGSRSSPMPGAESIRRS